MFIRLELCSSDDFQLPLTILIVINSLNFIGITKRDVTYPDPCQGIVHVYFWKVVFHDLLCLKIKLFSLKNDIHPRVCLTDTLYFFLKCYANIFINTCVLLLKNGCRL